jgi:hypothetical protein
VSGDGNKREDKTYLVVKASLLQHAACLHIGRLRGTSLLARSGRPREGIALPPGAVVHCSGWAKPSVVVRDKDTRSLRQELNHSIGKLFNESTYEGICAEEVVGIFTRDGGVRAEHWVGGLVLITHGESQLVLRGAGEATGGARGASGQSANDESGSDKEKE